MTQPVPGEFISQLVNRDVLWILSAPGGLLTIGMKVALPMGVFIWYRRYVSGIDGFQLTGDRASIFQLGLFIILAISGLLTLWLSAPAELDTAFRYTNDNIELSFDLFFMGSLIFVIWFLTSLLYDLTVMRWIPHKYGEEYQVKIDPNTQKETVVLDTRKPKQVGWGMLIITVIVILALIIYYAVFT